MSQSFTLALLGLIMLAVLIVPFFVRWIEGHLELFFLVMGVGAALVSRVLDLALVAGALTAPLKLTAAVLCAGALFKVARRRLRAGIGRLAGRMSFGGFMFLAVLLVGLLSGVITSVVAALVLVEIVAALRMDRHHEVFYVVVACFSIGLGSALTPAGGPVPALLLAALKGDPAAGFFWLFRSFGPFIIPGLAGFGLLAALRKGRPSPDALSAPDDDIGWADVAARGASIYVFVAALVLLGASFKPVADAYLTRVPAPVLYWLNMVSAVLDNATLVAAEATPALTREQLRDLVMGLSISGGMLIPGNVPNIICAGRLKITSREWALIGVPLGLSTMTVYFAVLLLV